MWKYMDHEYGWGGMFLGMFGMLLFWILLIAAAAAVIRYVWGAVGRPPRHHRERTALDILKERYARGEIEYEEFERKKRDLGE